MVGQRKAKTNKKGWKRWERDLAKIFGTSRRLMKGTDEVPDIGDHAFIQKVVLDGKNRPRSDWRIIPWFLNVEEYCIKKELPAWPVLGIRAPGDKNSFCFVRYAQLMQLIEYTESISEEDVHVLDVGYHKNLGFMPHWNSLSETVRRRIKTGTSKAGVIQILGMGNLKREDIKLAILKPKDLARLFMLGGIIPEKSD